MHADLASRCLLDPAVCLRSLNGKVYTVQDPRLPFAAVHGDPDFVAEGKTRFGPTALPLPLLERFNSATFLDFVQVVRPDMDLLKVYMELLNTSHMRNYVLRNFLYEVPKLNTTLFARVRTRTATGSEGDFSRRSERRCEEGRACGALQDVQKIVPSIREEDLTYAKGFGGIRPQLVDKKLHKLLLGEGKILTGELGASGQDRQFVSQPAGVAGCMHVQCPYVFASGLLLVFADDGIIFNITPSPGGTTCLGTGETDMRAICERLGAAIDEAAFKKALLEGAYPVNY